MTLDRADQAWREWFAQEQIDPLKITYEALAQKPVETVRDICSMLGIDTVNAAMMRPTIAKLADDINLEWTARYRAGVPPM